MDWNGSMAAVGWIAYSSKLSAFGSRLQLILAAIVVASAILALLTRLSRPDRHLKLPPGPPAFPVFGNWLQVGNDLNPRNLTDLAKKYGDIMLLKMGRRNVVVVSSPNLAKEVLVTQGVEFGSRTRNIVFDIFTGKGQDMVFTAYGDHWRRMRRIMTVPFFTQKVVRQSEGAWDDETRRVISDLTDRIESTTTGVVIRSRLQLMMYNIIYRMTFGKRFESEDDHLFLRLRSLNGERSSLAQSFNYNYADFIPLLRPFAGRYLQRCEDVKQRRIDLFKSYFLDERRKLLSSKGSNVIEKCAIDYIIEAQEQGEITEDNVLYIVENINAAGIETTLWSMEWAIAELVNNPNIQRKLQNELDEVLGINNLMQQSDIPKLPYLQAIIKETLRLHTAVPLLVPHMNLYQAKLGGYDIPAKSKILVNAWWLANNPSLWDNPKEFRPERFFDIGCSKIDMNGHDMRYAPFGVGRRSCPGMILALPLVSMMIGRLVQCFQLLTPMGVDKLDMSEELGQFSLHMAKHSRIVVKARDCHATPSGIKSSCVI